MGQTFTRLFDQMFGHKEMRVVMLGLDAAGGLSSKGALTVVQAVTHAFDHIYGCLLLYCVPLLGSIPQPLLRSYAVGTTAVTSFSFFFCTCADTLPLPCTC